jgi:hypothetical protein
MKTFDKDLVIELYNFVDDLTLGTNDLTESYIIFKAKRFVDMLKIVKNFVVYDKNKGDKNNESI